MSESTTFDFTEIDNDMEFMDRNELIEDKPEAPKTPEEPKQEDTSEAEKDLHNEYLVIYDSIMFEDKYERNYKLGSKYSATFSTRSTDSDMSISRQLDSMEFNTMHALQTMSAVLTLSHSLMELNGTDLRTKTVPERYNYIRSKSSHIIELLSKHMITFDALVRNALGYGEENF